MWVCLMGLPDSVPDNDPLVQCALQLEFVNSFICQPNCLTKNNADKWQLYLFKFGFFMAALFNVDGSTKLDRLMRHLDHHLIHLGCILRGSSKENEIADK